MVMGFLRVTYIGPRNRADTHLGGQAPKAQRRKNPFDP